MASWPKESLSGVSERELVPHSLILIHRSYYVLVAERGFVQVKQRVFCSDDSEVEEQAFLLLLV